MFGGDNMTAYESAFTRPPAPPPLDLVQAFLNSADLEDGDEAFATPDSLSAWVARHIPDAATSFTRADCARAIALREMLRDLVETGHPSPALQEALDAIPLKLRIATGEPELVTDREGIDAIFARVMVAVHHAKIDGHWKRLKICRNDVCRWAFYDASKNHSGVWCSMATCGSKAKARAYRTRTRRKATS
jgi:predicted RNA-binding Zn ribbon-like protein